jgi:TRAP-type C4-dicarboxylate transport system permease small subunit
MVQFLGNVGFLLFTTSALLFTLLYLSLSRWYKSFVGTIIAIFSSNVIILCVYLSLRVWHIEVPGIDWVRLIIFWILGIVMAISVIGFLQVQFGKKGARLRSRLSKRYSDVRNDSETENREV